MKTGVAFIPGTFPTGAVLAAVKEGLPASAAEWNRSKINDLYFCYKEGVQAGYPIVRENEFSVKKYMIENSNFTESDIRVFLYILYELAKAGDIDQKFWNIELQEKRKPVEMFDFVGKATKAVTWASIAGIFLGGLWFLYPYIKRSRRNG